MIEFSVYADKFTAILNFPGLRSDFKGSNFEMFAKGRLIEV